MNQIQSIRALSAGLISLSVAQISPDHISGEMRLPQKAARRDGSIGSNTAKSRPTRIENTPWLIKATIKPVPLNAVNCGRSASSQGGHRGRSEQVNRIPEAAVRNDTVHAGHDRHRDAANNTALDARRIRMNLRRNTNPVARHAGLLVAHCARSRRDRRGRVAQRAHAHQFVLFHRQHLAKPPHCAAHSQHQANQLMTACVTSPAASNARPRAVTKGQRWAPAT